MLSLSSRREKSVSVWCPYRMGSKDPFAWLEGDFAVKRQGQDKSKRTDISGGPKGISI